MLNPGAPVLLSLGGSEDEFTAPMFDVDFFYSAHAPDASVALMLEAGFDILVVEIDDPSSRGHMVILCRKRGLIWSAVVDADTKECKWSLGSLDGDDDHKAGDER